LAKLFASDDEESSIQPFDLKPASPDDLKGLATPE
jgi:hypothetical protein